LGRIDRRRTESRCFLQIWLASQLLGSLDRRPSVKRKTKSQRNAFAAAMTENLSAALITQQLPDSEKCRVMIAISIFTLQNTK
jgi:hypothetical protein